MSLSPNLRGVITIVLALGVFVGSDSCMKLALRHVPLFELIALRGVVSVTLCFGLLLVVGQVASLKALANPWVIGRGLCEVIANVSFNLAIFHLPIADVVAIAQICPLLILAGSALIFGEKLGASRFVLIGMGITGALLVAQPGSTAASPFAALGFLVAASAAARDLMTRKVPQDIPAFTVAFAVLLCLFLAGLIGMLGFETPVVPEIKEVGLTFLAGVLLVVGHIGIYYAYKIAPARTVAPFMYCLTIWAVLAGILFFGDYPNALAIAGMALILMTGLMVIFVDGHKSRTDAANS